MTTLPGRNFFCDAQAHSGYWRNSRFQVYVHSCAGFGSISQESVHLFPTCLLLVCLHAASLFNVCLPFFSVDPSFRPYSSRMDAYLLVGCMVPLYPLSSLVGNVPSSLRSSKYTATDSPYSKAGIYSVLYCNWLDFLHMLATLCDKLKCI